jgi:hypothetical protein
MPDSKLIEESKHFWSYGFHDNEYGRVTSICLSHDEKFMFTAGGDSNIFGVLFNSSKEDLAKAKLRKINVSAKPVETPAIDIDDPKAYSLEQEKQKSEHDKMVAIAEGKKLEMRQRITELRKSFKELLNKNEQLVPRIKLGKNVRIFDYLRAKFPEIQTKNIKIAEIDPKS